MLVQKIDANEMFKVEDYKPLNHFSKNELSELINLNISNTDLRDDGTIPKSRFRAKIIDYLDGYALNGLLCRMWNNEEIIAWSFLEKKEFGLDFSIYVIPKFRRKKIGSFLFNLAQIYAKNNNCYKLTTHQWNKNSFEFYSCLEKKHKLTTISKKYIPKRQHGTMEFSI